MKNHGRAQQFPPEYAGPVAMARLKGMPQKHIAAMTGISPRILSDWLRHTPTAHLVDIAVAHGAAMVSRVIPPLADTDLDTAEPGTILHHAAHARLPSVRRRADRALDLIRALRANLADEQHTERTATKRKK